MKRIIEKIIYIFAIVIIIVGANMQVFAKEKKNKNPFKEDLNFADLADLMNKLEKDEYSAPNLVEAYKKGKVKETFVDDKCKPLFKKDKEFMKYEKYMQDCIKYRDKNNNGKSEVWDNEVAVKNFFVYEKKNKIAIGKKAIKKCAAYLEIEDWGSDLKKAAKATKKAKEIKEDEKKQKDMMSYSLKEMVDCYVELDHTIVPIEELENGKAILNKWNEKMQATLLPINDASFKGKFNDKIASDPKGHTYNDDYGELKNLVSFWCENANAKQAFEIYQNPEQVDSDGGTSSEKSLEDMINDADTFINTGTAQYNQESMQNFSKTIYNILFTVGVFVAVIMGGIIGIKLMVSSASEKADVKKLLVPYVVGCVVVFGGFGIWKLVVTILQGM